MTPSTRRSSHLCCREPVPRRAQETPGRTQDYADRRTADPDPGSPTSAVWPASAVLATRLRRSPAMIHRYSPVPSTITIPFCDIHWCPSPCERLSRPRTTTAPPPHPRLVSGRRACLPDIAGCGARQAKRDGSHVHCCPFETGGRQLCPCGIVTATPQTFTVTSPPRPTNRRESSPPEMRGGCAPQSSPDPPSFELAQPLRGFTHWFLASAFVSRLPDPHRSAVLVRPGFVRAAFRPYRRLPGRTALSYSNHAAT